MVLNESHGIYPDYTCPVNGLCDIYEWKNGQRIDDEFILGMQMGVTLISNSKSDIPKMIMTFSQR